MSVEEPIVEPPPLGRNQQAINSGMNHPWDQSFATHYFLFWTNHLKRFGESSSKNNCSNEMGTRLHVGSKIAAIKQTTRGLKLRNAPSQPRRFRLMK
jgi:hypothetical protein